MGDLRSTLYALRLVDLLTGSAVLLTGETFLTVDHVALWARVGGEALDELDAARVAICVGFACSGGCFIIHTLPWSCRVVKPRIAAVAALKLLSSHDVRGHDGKPVRARLFHLLPEGGG